MNQSFLRTEMLLGREAMARLKESHVLVVGLGGVGSAVVEALARSGVGSLTLVDQDTFGETNLNRQLGALHSTIGKTKAEALRDRVLDINPTCNVISIVTTYNAETREQIFSTRYDYVADAIDLVSCKIDLIKTAIEREIPILSALGTGNKLDPTKLEVTDLSKTKGCPLARVMRKELKALGITHLKVVYSCEEPQPCLQMEAPPPGRRSVPGSVSWVPSVAGLILGGTIVQDLIRDLLPKESNTICY